jgi:hypothetical protein
MDIAKAKGIIDLSKELKELQQVYLSKQKSVKEHWTKIMLDSAIEAFNVYLEDQGFTVTADEGLTRLKATLDGELPIILDRKPFIFSVNMPNDERYTVEIESDLKLQYNEHRGKGQDLEISYLKRDKENVKELISLIEGQSFYYLLHMETRSFYRSLSNCQKFTNFQEALKVMFS